MGMSNESSQIDLLRLLAARQGVHPTDEDLSAVLGFLEQVLPRLREIEALVPPDTAPDP